MFLRFNSIIFFVCLGWACMPHRVPVSLHRVARPWGAVARPPAHHFCPQLSRSQPRKWRTYCCSLQVGVSFSQFSAVNNFFYFGCSTVSFDLIKLGNLSLKKTNFKFDKILKYWHIKILIRPFISWSNTIFQAVC